MTDGRMGSRWDVFISHASEDNESVAKPLARLLEAGGLKVWIDENQLNLGDNLRRTIDNALALSTFGVVILSRAFFAKEWTQRELDGLAARESTGKKIILPVWHGIDHDFVAVRAPMLADRLSISTERGLAQVALTILAAVTPPPPISREAASSLLENKLDYDDFPRLTPALTDNEAGAIDLSNLNISNKEIFRRFIFGHPELLVGHQIGPYWLTALLGSGGSGIVFRATKRTLAREAALKIFYPLREELGKISTIWERALRSLTALNHPNIASVFDFGHHDLHGTSLSFLAMEFVEGIQLDQWSARLRGQRDAFVRRLEIANKIAIGVDAAHNTEYLDQVGFQVRGILHGDIKPGNILVTADENVKLLDFMLIDVQRLLDRGVFAGRDAQGAERATWIFGTPGFMAREQEQLGIVTVQTDVFSLGETLKVLFAVDSADLPIDLTHLITRMTDPEPTNRPRDMREVGERLLIIRKKFGRSRNAC